MPMTLMEHLQGIRDFRTQPIYPLWVILLLVIMGTMSGCTGYRSLAEFVARHQEELLTRLQLPRTRLPSLSTLRRVMVRLDFESFLRVFNAWVQDEFGGLDHQQVPIDGKSIKASLSDYDQPYQDFVAMVSAFSVTQGLVVGIESMRNKHTSELETVSTLLEGLHLQGVCFSLDALHAKKKRFNRLSPAAMTI